MMIPDREYTRVEAIRALAGSHSPEVEERLLEAAQDESPQVRRAALAVLGEWFDSDHEPVFLAALDDEDKEVRRVAAGHLFLLGDDSARLVTARLLARIVSPENTLLLVSALWDEWHKVREVATRALIAHQDPVCIEPVAELALNRRASQEVRRSAIAVLGGFAQPEALETLGILLVDGDLGRPAAVVLGDNPAHRAADILLETLGSKNSEARLSAAQGIRRNGDPRALHPLCIMLTERDPLVRRAAAEALGGLAEKLDAAKGQEYPAGLRAEVVLAEGIVPLTLACSDPDELVRSEAVHALGAIGASESHPLILAALRDASGWEFHEAARAAAAHKIPGALDLILTRLQGELSDQYDIMLSGGIFALGKLGDRRALPFLMRCADSARWDAKVGAAQALLALGEPRGWELLVAALGAWEEDRFGYGRAEVARALAESGDPRAVDVLLAALEGIKADQDPDENFLEALIECLGKTGDPHAREPIARWLGFEFADREGLVEDALENLLNHPNGGPYNLRQRYQLLFRRAHCKE